MTKTIIRTQRTSTSLNDIRRKVMLLSSQLRKHYKSHGIQLSRSELMEFSWRFIRSHQDSVFAMYFKKYDKKGQVKEYARRLVYVDTTGHITFTGTGRPLKPGQRLFVDVARDLVKTHLVSKLGEDQVKVNTIISTYENYCPITGGSRITSMF